MTFLHWRRNVRDLLDLPQALQYIPFKWSIVKKTKNSTFHIQYFVWPHPFAYICFSQWGLLIQADRLCLWIHRAVLLTHAYLSWRCLCPLSGIWPQPYNQLSVINRNTGRTNLAVTTNKHLWGRLKASRGFLLHINTLDNTDAETRADTHTLTLNPPPPTHSSVQKVTILSCALFWSAETNAFAPSGFRDKQIGLSFGEDKRSSVHTKVYKMAPPQW